MRLISKFKDYYDGLQGTDREATPLYLRTESREVIDSKDKARIAEIQALVDAWVLFPSPPQNVFIRTRFLGFCGKIYPFYLWEGGAYDTPEDLVAAAIAAPEPREHNRRMDHQRLIRAAEDPTNWGGWSGGGRTNWMRWEAQGAPRLEESHTDLFRDFDTPVFTLHRSRQGLVVTKNPCLQELGWHRRLPPYQAWQSIDMYLSNQLARQEDPESKWEPISDELRRDAHGFDNKSFKSGAPSEKKARRKLNRKRKREQADAEQ